MKSRKKPNHMMKKHNVSVYLTYEQREELEKRATDAGLYVSEYLRKILFSKKE